MSQENPPTQPNPEQQVVYVQAPKAPWYKRPGCLIPLVLGILLLLGIGGCMAAIGNSVSDSVASSSSSSSSAEAVADDSPAIAISAVDYVAAYDTNEIAADKEYKGKKLEVTGTVDSVNETFGSYHLTLDGPSDGIASVSCRLEDSELDRAGSLTPGGTATVTGIGDGFDGFNAFVKNCKIQ